MWIDPMIADGAAEPRAATRAELQGLSDSDLLIRLRGLPRASDERDAICEILVSRYASLVRSAVRRYRNSPEPVEDLMQVGYVGLLKAINNFDPAYGNGLQAYAEPCVSGEIKRHFRDRRWQIHVSRQAQELLLEMRRAEDELTHQLSRAPQDSELAKHLGVTLEEVTATRQAGLAFSAYSLEAPLSSHDNPGQLSDLLGEDDEAVEHAVDMEAVKAHWDELTEREQRVLVLRFYGNLTQAEIGLRLGFSQMHISRLLNRALSHLRNQLTSSAGT